MSTRRSNPLKRFYDADHERTLRLYEGAMKRGTPKEEAKKLIHDKTWWAAHLGVERTLFSKWLSGSRRIGPSHEAQVFKVLRAYWARHPKFSKPYRFTFDEYRRAVPTAGQITKTRDIEKLPCGCMPPAYRLKCKEHGGRVILEAMGASV